MKPFTFHNPTKIVFGAGTVDQIGAEAKAVGRKALLVCGRESIRKNGVYDRVAASLKAAGIAWVEHAGVKPNPVLSHVRRGIALVQEHGTDFILAVGGGSVIDESKAIAAGAAAPTDVWAYYDGSAKIEKALPIATVLTLPATGTEMNGGTVVTNEETQEKNGLGAPALFPRVSILDPAVTLSLPRPQTAYGTTDAMTHLLEGYFTHDAGWVPLQERYAEAVIRSLMESAERILADSKDLEARSVHMWAATLAWNTLAPCGLGAFTIPNHMLEHPISAVHDIPHGAGLSTILPAWMAFETKRKGPARFARFARGVMGVTAADDAEAAVEGTARLKTWFDKVGTPTSFATAGIEKPDLDRLAGLALKLCALWEITGYTKDDLVTIYRSCL